MYMHIVVIRKATFDVFDYPKGIELKKISDEHIDISYIDDNGNTRGEPYNPNYYSIYVLGVE